LAALAEQIGRAAAEHSPQLWPLYEMTYKDARFVNQPGGRRAPIDEYHLLIDRPPRGAGIYVAISGAEQRVIVALQLGGRRKTDLKHAWELHRDRLEALVADLPDVRFNTRSLRDPDLAQPRWPHWIDRYLAARGAAYLLAGTSWPWADPRIATPAIAEPIIAAVLQLLPLCEAIMQQADRQPHERMLHEDLSPYRLSTPEIETIVSRIQSRGLTFSTELIQAYHVAIHTKPLVILPGISGTGKTRLTRLYADAVHAIPANAENDRYLRVAVQPDWHNARDLFGYYNAITNKFHATPFLRFVLRAIAEPEAAYFACLDEMNLARPEYYLAPIISALETDDRLIDLGIPTTLADALTGEQIPNPLRFPENLFMTGTVNIDESTHPLSDKLLDRANLIELTEVDLEAFRANWPHPIDRSLWEAISSSYAICARAGFPFGYRVVSEMLRYLEQAQGILAPARALDLQLKQKILPRLRGEDTPRLRRGLAELLALTERGPLGALPESSDKIRRMQQRLEQDGFTDFYGG
jgi:MoxR-like ATPase